MTMKILDGQDSNTTTDWARPGAGDRTVGASGTFGTAGLKLQLGKDAGDGTIALLPDDPELVIADGDAPFVITLLEEDYVRAVVSTADGTTAIDCWI